VLRVGEREREREWYRNKRKSEGERKRDSHGRDENAFFPRGKWPSGDLHRWRRRRIYSDGRSEPGGPYRYESARVRVRLPPPRAISYDGGDGNSWSGKVCGIRSREKNFVDFFSISNKQRLRQQSECYYIMGIILIIISNVFICPHFFFIFFQVNARAAFVYAYVMCLYRPPYKYHRGHAWRVTLLTLRYKSTV